MASVINMKSLSLMLLMILAVESSSSRSYRYRYRNQYRYRFYRSLYRSSYTKYTSCKDYCLPENTERVPRSDGVKSFKCCEGFELIVKVHCYYGKWYHKFVCVPIENDDSATTSTEPSTTVSTEPTTTLSDPVQCDDNPDVPNGQLDGTVISTDVGATVGFICNSGFTGNGTEGTLTCSASGVFEADILCEDCTSQDMAGTGRYTPVPATDQEDCTRICNTLPGCRFGTFGSSLCFLDFSLGNENVNSFDECRLNCYEDDSCEAFSFIPMDPIPCSKFAREFDTFNTDTTRMSSNCL